MIIHPPLISTNENDVLLSAQVEMHRPVAHVPETLWYRFPGVYRPWLSERADPFAAGLLLAAMHLGEDIEIRAPISPRLLYGLQEAQHIYHLHYPRVFQPIRIQAPVLAEAFPDNQAKHVALTFSGGADSFFTLWSHLAENHPLQDFHITHCIFVQGFDIPLSLESDYEKVCQRFTDLLQPHGIVLIQCRTNVQAFIATRVKWVNAYGPAVISTALALGGGIKRLLTSSVHPYHIPVQSDATPLSDHWLSTETLEVIHYGSGKTRLEKLEILGGWPAARENLRVCTNLAKRDGVHNCSRCSKCLRNLTMLKVIGIDDRFSTFKQPFQIQHMLRWLLVYTAEEPWIEQTLRYAASHRKMGYIPILLLILLAGKLRTLLMRLIPYRLYRWLKNRFYPPEKSPFGHRSSSTAITSHDHSSSSNHSK